MALYLIERNFAEQLNVDPANIPAISQVNAAPASNGCFPS